MPDAPTPSVACPYCGEPETADHDDEAMRAYVTRHWAEDWSDSAALTPAQEDAITRIAAMPPGVGRHAAFLRCVLDERPWFVVALMSRLMKSDPPLTEAEMRYIAERWHADVR